MLRTLRNRTTVVLARPRQKHLVRIAGWSITVGWLWAAIAACVFEIVHRPALGAVDGFAVGLATMLAPVFLLLHGDELKAWAERRVAAAEPSTRG